MKTTSQDILDALREQGCAARTTTHEAVFTVAQSRAIKEAIPGGHTKNLFLKDKKGRLFLVTAEAEARVDLKRLHETIGASGRLSFGSAELLRETLGVEPGSVTPLALVNDEQGRVSFVLDSRLAEGEIINVHPLVNTMMTSLAVSDLVAFLADSGHETRVLALPEPAVETGETREPIPS
ncbi:MAG: prolyl-tRNA synthetase associated domain-containing protein [Salinarimonadaceae bacterium]|nr:MAG: prolyl-tRNA synthetase associated domain-containing protein [Salinarimonadaceae bacterium]